MGSRGARLGVNLDHVATLREQRDEGYPDLIRAVEVAVANGADQVTIHLREDRRHIQDEDVLRVREATSRLGVPLNLELGCAPDIVELAAACGPEWICLVPENRQERTTEGGLNLLQSAVFERVAEVIAKIRKCRQTKFSLFLAAQPPVLARAWELGVEGVEMHTGDYARAWREREDLAPYFAAFESGAQQLARHRIACHAGHGLTGDSLSPLVARELFEEYNIGHWIIAESIFRGLGPVVRELKELCQSGVVKGE